MNSEYKLTRRELLKTAAVITPVVVSGCAALPVESDADPLVRTEDPVARAVAYYSNTRDVPTYSPLAGKHEVSQNCANCLHRRGNAAPDRIICGTFPGRTVSPKGWCSIWAQG